MGYTLDGSSHGMRLTGAPNVLGGFSWSLRIRPHSATPASDQWIFGEQSATGANNFGIWLTTAGKIWFYKYTTLDADAGAISSGTVNANAWNHIYWSYNTYDSGNEYQVSLNGETMQLGNFTVSGATILTRLGSRTTGGAGRADYFDGDVAELAIWNDVIDQVGTGAWASLAHGYSPLRVDRQYLIHYWPFRKGERDEVGGRTMTLEGGLALGDQHPPMFPASKKRGFLL